MWSMDEIIWLIRDKYWIFVGFGLPIRRVVVNFSHPEGMTEC